MTASSRPQPTARDHLLDRGGATCGRVRTFRPNYLSFAGTYQCNLSCPHCCVPIEWPDRLDVGTALRFLEEAHPAGVRTPGVTGGGAFPYFRVRDFVGRRAASSRLCFGMVMTERVLVVQSLPPCSSL